MPVTVTLAPLGGTITVVDAIEVITQGGSQIVTLDFSHSAPDVAVAFDAASVALLQPALAAAGLTIAQVRAMVAGNVLGQLQTAIGRLDLTPPIPVVDDTDATTVFDIDVTTINDASAADGDRLVFGIRMASDTGGNINLATTNFIPAGGQSLVMMSHFWLLARVMRPRVASAMGRPASDFDTPPAASAGRSAACRPFRWGRSAAGCRCTTSPSTIWNCAARSRARCRCRSRPMAGMHRAAASRSIWTPAPSPHPKARPAT